MRAPDGTEWVGVGEVARRLSVPRGRIDQWVHRGRVRSIRVDGRRYVCFQDAANQERQSRGRWGVRLQ